MPDNVQIIYKAVKRISLRVKPDLAIILTVPLHTKPAEIERMLNKHNDWILRKLEFFKKFVVPSQELVSGENFAYLGKNYRLKVISGDSESVILAGGYLNITLSDTMDYQRKSQLIDAWYHQKAKYHFTLMIDKYLPVVNKTIAKVSVRRMKTRWGSCNPRKSYINLNLDLIKKHPLAIEYVVFHELVHLIHYYHDHRFYNYLATHMPDWQSRKSRLEL